MFPPKKNWVQWSPLLREEVEGIESLPKHRKYERRKLRCCNPYIGAHFRIEPHVVVTLQEMKKHCIIIYIHCPRHCHIHIASDTNSIFWQAPTFPAHREDHQPFIFCSLLIPRVTFTCNSFFSWAQFHLPSSETRTGHPTEWMKWISGLFTTHKWRSKNSCDVLCSRFCNM